MRVDKIAVIGGGIFGLEVATTLSKLRHDVILFEKEDSVLTRTTSNNQNRLHLGLHYPRDLETARQSRVGFENFIRKYPSCVKQDFNNYYGVSKLGSLTSTDAFIEFAKMADIDIERIGNSDAKSLGFNLNLIDSLWSCREAVIDIAKYTTLALEAARVVDLKISCGTQVTRAFFDGSSWHLFSEEVLLGSFDVVILATYGQDKIEVNIPAVNERVYEYQQTLVHEVSSPARSFGLTVIDGDFVTILPSGFSSNFLIYSPLPSVLNRYVGTSVPENWDFNDETIIEKSYELVSERALNYAPILGATSRIRTLKAIRSLEPFVAKTDKRTSYFKDRSAGFYEIHSGKVDHAIAIAEAIAKLLSDSSS
jgi:hypothetical protein